MWYKVELGKYQCTITFLTFPLQSFTLRKFSFRPLLQIKKSDIKYLLSQRFVYGRTPLMILRQNYHFLEH